jgi:hypothetical protein
VMKIAPDEIRPLPKGWLPDFVRPGQLEPHT